MNDEAVLKSLVWSFRIFFFQSYCNFGFGTIRIVIFFWSSFWNFTPSSLIVQKKTSKHAYFIDYGGNHYIKL